MNTIDEAIQILEGIRGGRRLECKNGAYWLLLPPGTLPNFAFATYRLRPEPLECWVNHFSGGGSIGYPSEVEARKGSILLSPPARVAVHMREVVE